MIWPWPWSQGHIKCCQVPSTSCGLCTCKLWSCYVQCFRRRFIYKKIHYLTLGYLTLTPRSRSHEVLPSTLNIMRPIHRPNLKLLLPNNVLEVATSTFGEMRFQENTLFDLWPWPWGQGHKNVAQYSWNHVTYAQAKFEVATSKSLWGDAFTRKYIIWPWPWPWDQAHTKCHPVPSTSCDLCTYKVSSCYVQRFRRRYNYKKRDGRTDRQTDRRTDARTDDGPTLVRN